jgi:beta-N-acetylhexosaminidase
LFGFNINFAPVLDINSNPQNPVIGNRSFGDNAEIVSKLGVQTMKGIQSGGVISVVKHLPGHGDTSEDSHIGLPVVNHDLDRIMDFELVPFKNAIKNQADAVMIAHILLKSIDSENPSSLSETVITDLLRNQLKFEGVIVTDDITMGAIIENYNIGEAAVKAVNAGNNIILVCHGYDNQIAVIDALINAAESNEIPKEKIDDSVYRILKLKDKYKLSDIKVDPINFNDIQKINGKIDALY